MSITVAFERPDDRQLARHIDLAEQVVAMLKAHDPIGMHVRARVHCHDRGVVFSVFLDDLEHDVRMHETRDIDAWLAERHRAHGFLLHEVRGALSNLARACVLYEAKPGEEPKL